MKKRFGRYFALIAFVALAGMVLFACGQQQDKPADANKEAKTIEKCYRRLTAGNAKLDPKLNNTKLITRWRLWVPKNWKRMEPFD